MSLSFTRCAYHSDRAAITVCERCRRPICLEDKRIYRRRHTRYAGEVSTYYYTSHDYCILCNAAQIETDVSRAPIGIIIFVIVAILIFVPFFSISAFSDMGSFSPFFLMLILIIGLIGIMFIYNFRNKQDEAKIANNEALEFKRQLNMINNQNNFFMDQNNSSYTKTFTNTGIEQNNTDISSGLKSDTLYCFECGTKLELTDNFCPNCGDNTQDELKAYYKIHKK